MNLNRGLFRITLILSIIGAIVGTYIAYKEGTNAIYRSRDRLDYLKGLKFSIYEEQIIINEWQQILTQKFLDNQIEILGKQIQNMQKGIISKEEKTDDFPITEKPEWLKAVEELEEKGVNIPIETQERIQRRNQELDKLRERGWKTVNGEAMPLTPEEVWNKQHPRLQADIKEAEKTVFENVNFVSKGMLLGGLFGFIAVWISYCIIKISILLARPLLLWIFAGFLDGTQKK